MANCGKRRTAVLVDRQPLWLEAVQGVLERAEINVAAKASSYDQGLELLRKHRPDLLVVSMDDETGQLDAADWLGKATVLVADLKVVVLSARAEPDRVEAAFAAGASAYVLKSAEPDDLRLAIRQTFESSLYLAGFRSETRPGRLSLVADGPRLTRREIEILQLVAEGLPNAQLALRLWVTEQTVKFHLSNIYRKLGVSNRTEASHWALVHGLLSASKSASAG